MCRATFKLLNALNRDEKCRLQDLNELLTEAQIDQRLKGDKLKEFSDLLKVFGKERGATIDEFEEVLRRVEILDRETTENIHIIVTDADLMPSIEEKKFRKVTTTWESTLKVPSNVITPFHPVKIQAEQLQSNCYLGNDEDTQRINAAKLLFVCDTSFLIKRSQTASECCDLISRGEIFFTLFFFDILMRVYSITLDRWCDLPRRVHVFACHGL